MTSNSERPGTDPVRPVVGMYSFYTRDPQRLGAFWGQLMGLPTAPGATDDLVMLDLHHEVAATTWIFQRREDVVAGTGPIGLDIGVESEDRWGEVADQAEALGARRVGENDEQGVRWVDMLDPDGNRFRVFAPRPAG